MSVGVARELHRPGRAGGAACMEQSHGKSRPTLDHDIVLSMRGKHILSSRRKPEQSLEREHNESASNSDRRFHRARATQSRHFGPLAPSANRTATAATSSLARRTGAKRALQGRTQPVAPERQPARSSAADGQPGRARATGTLFRHHLRPGCASKNGPGKPLAMPMDCKVILRPQRRTTAVSCQRWSSNCGSASKTAIKARTRGQFRVSVPIAAGVPDV